MFVAFLCHCEAEGRGNPAFLKTVFTARFAQDAESAELFRFLPVLPLWPLRLCG
jgi:hypothetical protein